MRKTISIFLLISLLIVNINTVNVFASGYQPNDGGYWNSLWGTVSNGVLNGYNEMLRTVGFVVDTAVSVGRANVNFVKDRLVALGLLNSNATEQDVQQFFENNITEGNNSVTLSNNLNVYLKSEAQAIMSNTGYFYAYSYNITNSATQFPSGTMYNAVASYCDTYQNDHFIGFVKGNSYWLYIVPFGNLGCVVGTRNTTNDCYSKLFDYTTWEQHPFTGTDVYKWNNSLQMFEQMSNITVPNSDSQILMTKFIGGTKDLMSNINCINHNARSTFKVYNTLDDFKAASVNIVPYYLSDKWNTYNENSGNYTVDSSNSNNITYGDITNYINSYNTENGKYPTPTEINVYIDNNIPQTTPTPTPTPNPDDPGGGESGGSGEGETGIFDFLSRLGTVLGNLIKNLGEMLTNLIEGIVETITSVVGAIPNIFQPLIGYVFGGLPESIQAMIILGITCMIVVGIIKAFKG